MGYRVPSLTAFPGPTCKYSVRRSLITLLHTWAALHFPLLPTPRHASASVVIHTVSSRRGSCDPRDEYWQRVFANGRVALQHLGYPLVGSSAAALGWRLCRVILPGLRLLLATLSSTTAKQRRREPATLGYLRRLLIWRWRRWWWQETAPCRNTALPGQLVNSGPRATFAMIYGDHSLANISTA